MKLPIPWKPTPRSVWAFDDLARYNAEVARGLVHTPEWAERMAAQQATFDRLYAQAATEDAAKPVEGERSSVR